MKATSGKAVAHDVDFFGAMPGAYYDLEQRLESLYTVTRLIPVIGAENDAPDVVAVEIDMANNLVAALENLTHLARQDLQLLRFSLAGGAHPRAAGDGMARSSVAGGSAATGMPPGQKLPSS
jgi:hypothetical protein